MCCILLFITGIPPFCGLYGNSCLLAPFPPIFPLLPPLQPPQSVSNPPDSVAMNLVRHPDTSPNILTPPNAEASMTSSPSPRTPLPFSADSLIKQTPPKPPRPCQTSPPVDATLQSDFLRTFQQSLHSSLAEATTEADDPKAQWLKYLTAVMLSTINSSITKDGGESTASKIKDENHENPNTAAKLFVQ